MAANIGCFIADLNPDPVTGREFLACCHSHGIKKAIDLAVLSSSDMCVLCEGSSAATVTFSAVSQAAAKMLAHGWARGSTLRPERAVSEVAVAASSASRVVPATLPPNAPHPSTPSCRRIESSVIAVTRRVLTGFLPDAPVGAHGLLNNATTREAQMAKAVRGAEEVFNNYAHDSSRARALSASTSAADWSLHHATCIGSFTVAKSVHLRYRTAELFSAIANAYVADS